MLTNTMLTSTNTMHGSEKAEEEKEKKEMCLHRSLRELALREAVRSRHLVQSVGAHVELAHVFVERSGTRVEAEEERRETQRVEERVEVAQIVVVEDGHLNAKNVTDLPASTTPLVALLPPATDLPLGTGGGDAERRGRRRSAACPPLGTPPPRGRSRRRR